MSTKAQPAMILEGVVTTLNEDGSVNIAPMGPIVDGDEFILRPFSSSKTYANLRRHGQGVFHVTDDVLLIARAAVGNVDAGLSIEEGVSVPRLTDCCRWQAFQVEASEWGERATLRTRSIRRGRVRDFFGFNRAKHAVIEATILATRVHLLDNDEILLQLDLLRPLISKTAGEQEIEAFALIEETINRSIRQKNTG